MLFHSRDITFKLAATHPWKIETVEGAETRSELVTAHIHGIHVSTVIYSVAKTMLICVTFLHL